MMRRLGAGALARLDDGLVERIGRGDRLGAVALSCVATLVAGAGAYGIAFGFWRAPAQAVYSAVKLPLLFLAVAACTIGLGAMLALLLRARLSLAQTAVCILLSFAVTSALLGAVAPIALLVSVTVPPPDPAALGLLPDDPRAAPSMAVARALLLVHVFVVASAGTAGVARVRALLLRLGNDEAVTRRVQVAWIASQFFVGTQLSWFLRPFFGRPHLPPTLTAPEGVFTSSFFAEVWTLTRSTFGAGAPFAVGAAVASLALGMAWAMRTRARKVFVRREALGLVVLGAAPRFLPWTSLASARARGAEVVLELAPDEALAREVLTVQCRDVADAVELARTADAERTRVQVGPFRTASA
jgi:hypothetical protein